MSHMCNDAKMCLWFVLFTLLTRPLAVGASPKPLPTYFRYDVLKPGALTSLVVGDFNGDGHTDIAGLSPSQRSLILLPAKGKLTFHNHQSLWLSSRVLSLIAVRVSGEKHADLVTLAASPRRVQMWRMKGTRRKLTPEKQAELLLPDGTKRLYLLREHSQDKPHFFALSETGALTTFSFQAKEGFSKDKPLVLSHRVSEVIVPLFPTSDFFTQTVGENILWLHRAPPASPLAIQCKESIIQAATGDFNKNSLLDLVIVQAVANGKTAVEVMFDVGVETGIAPIQFETPLNATQVFVQDFNADGLLDIGLCDGNSFAIHFAQSPTTFFESMLIAFSSAASGIAVADLNHDRKPELIVSEQKTGKLVIYSTSHYETFGVERLATSGEPEQIVFHSARKQILVGCNRHHRLEQIKTDRSFLRVGSFSVTGKIVSVWQDEFEMVCLTNSPVTLVRKSYKSEKVVSHRLFLLGVSQSQFWRALEGEPAILAILEERTVGAVPQLLFYALNRDSTLSISELLLDAPISAENVVSIGGATLKKKHYLVMLKSEKNTQTLLVYELKVEKTRLRLLESERHLLPNLFAKQGAKYLLVKVNKHETMDFLVASSKRAVVLLSERLHQPQQISNFPKLSATDVVLWNDSDGNHLADLIISRHQRAEVLFMRGRPNGQFNVPRVIMNDVIATGIAPVVTKHHSTLFVANAKLHTVDIFHLKK